MNVADAGGIQLNDRFTYGSSPFGDRVLTIAFIGTGSIALSIFLLARVSGMVFVAALAGLLILAWLGYKRLLRLHSDIALGESGITRYIASGPWLTIPWTSIDKVVVQRVYGSNDTVGSKGYFLYLKKMAESGSAAPRRYKIRGMMSRSAQFYEAFLANLRLRGISVDERDTGAP